jgi:phosphomannomutase
MTDFTKVKLVVSDMDGTLLNSQGQVSSQFFNLFKELKKRNITFCAASGRQHNSIIDKLSTIKDDIYIIAENGGVGIRSRVGHSYIKSMMAQTGAVFGGEHSGHFYFNDFWRADSGMLAALYALAELMGSNSSLSELLKPYNRYISSGEINTKVKNVTKSISHVRDKYHGKYQVDELDGLTITASTWWFNLRPSNTEPLLRLNVEADTEKEMIKIRDAVLALI